MNAIKCNKIKERQNYCVIEFIHIKAWHLSEQHQPVCAISLLYWRVFCSSELFNNYN